MDVAWLVLKYRFSRRRPPHPPVAGIQFHRDFWRGHAGHRLGDERRFHSKEESDAVKQRIAEVLRDKGIVGNNGRFLPGAPSNVAIRTHILDRDRNPDGVDIRGRPLSNGNTIVGIVREHPDYPGTAKLQTTMLRRDEWRGEMQQAWTPKALGVQRVFTHSDASGDDVGGTPEGMGYTQLKSDEPMDPAFQLLKAKRKISDPAYWRRFGNPGPLVTPRIPKKKKVKRTFDDSGLSEEDKTKYALERREDEAKRREEKARILQENQERRQRYQDSISEIQRLYQEEQRRKQEEERRMTEAQAVGEVGQDEPESMYDNLDWDRMRTGEPMDIAFQLLKERKSPEAMRRKLEYDKQYEKTPERRKYQRELHAERRKRGIYGTDDHMDVSHTQGGRLTLEPEHANRARHFKDRGTLRVV